MKLQGRQSKDQRRRAGVVRNLLPVRRHLIVSFPQAHDRAIIDTQMQNLTCHWEV